MLTALTQADCDPQSHGLKIKTLHRYAKPTFDCCRLKQKKTAEDDIAGWQSKFQNFNVKFNRNVDR